MERIPEIKLEFFLEKLDAEEMDWQAVSTLHLTSIRIFLNAASSFSSLPAVAGVSSTSTCYSLVQRWNSVLSFKPLRVPIQLI